MSTIGRKVPPHLIQQSDLGKPIIVFLTVCSFSREPLFANDLFHASLRESWAQSPEWLVGRYVVMPDHIHLFCSPNREEFSLGQWVAKWKALTTRGLRMGLPKENPSLLTRRGVACDAPDFFRTIWQKNFWDRQLRSDESYDEKWNYVRQNPVRHGLVTKVEAWTYQGEMNILPW